MIMYAASTCLRMYSMYSAVSHSSHMYVSISLLHILPHTAGRARGSCALLTYSTVHKALKMSDQVKSHITGAWLHWSQAPRQRGI